MVVMVTSFDISQEIFSIDVLRALKTSLKHRRKQVLRSFRLYGYEALIIFLFIANNKMIHSPTSRDCYFYCS